MVIHTCNVTIVIGSLSLALGNTRYLSVLDGALVSCTIVLPDGTTVGLYNHLKINCEHTIYYNAGCE